MTGIALAAGPLLVASQTDDPFLLGTAETFADITTQTLLPMVGDPLDLGVGNARLMFGNITINRLAGPPIGAVLFAAGVVLPFATQAICVALGAMLVGQMNVPANEHARSGHHVRREIVDGLRWVWAHPAIRTLTITIVAFNITFGAVWSILVLYATERLGLGAVGFGLISSVGAVGGVVGASAYGWLERRLGMANVLRIGLVIETFFHSRWR